MKFKLGLRGKSGNSGNTGNSANLQPPCSILGIPKNTKKQTPQGLFFVVCRELLFSLLDLAFDAVDRIIDGLFEGAGA